MTGFSKSRRILSSSSHEQTLDRISSPDTNFSKPFLSGKEFKIYEELRGTVTGKFEYSERHPKAKVISNRSFYISAIVGLGIASVAMSGQRTINRRLPYQNSTPTDLITNPPGVAAANAAYTAMLTANAAAFNAAWTAGGALLANAIGIGPAAYYNAFQTTALQSLPSFPLLPAALHNYRPY